MSQAADSNQVIRFGVFELDIRAGQLRKRGMRLSMQGLPVQLLAHLLQHAGQVVTREELRAQLWPADTFVDFDHSLHNAIARLREALGDSADSPKFIETLPRKGYRFIGHVEDSRPAGKDGEEKTGNRNGAVAASRWPWDEVISPARRQWVLLLAAGVAAVLLISGYLVHQASERRQRNDSRRVVIGVVSLKNLNGDPGQDYFVSGLTEEVVTQLGQLNPDRIGVVRYNTQTAAGQEKLAIRELAEKSGMEYLLEGSVRRQDAQVRISLQLVRVADQSTVWTESFDRNVSDVLALQSEIAQRIGHELEIRVLGHSSPKSANPEAIESYLRGRFELSRNYSAVPDAARVNFERAVALDSSYAPAYAGLADFYRSRAVEKDADSDQAWSLAGEYADKALALDSKNAEAHAALAQIRLIHDWDWKAAREHALEALQLNPSLPEAHSIYARYLRVTGNLAEAVNQRKQALALDPFRSDLREQLGAEYFFARDYENAAALAHQRLTEDPQDSSAHYALCAVLGHLKLFDESVVECGKVLALEGHTDWIDAYLLEYRKHGYEAASLLLARKRLKEIQKQSQPDLWDLANAYAAAGMVDETLRTLEKGLPIREPGLLQLRVDPDFETIRGDPRYADLLRKIGFPTE